MNVWDQEHIDCYFNSVCSNTICPVYLEVKCWVKVCKVHEGSHVIWASKYLWHSISAFESVKALTLKVQIFQFVIADKIKIK